MSHRDRYDDLDDDAMSILESVADELGVQVSDLQIPRSKVEALYEAVDEDDFRKGLKQAFEQL